MSDSLRPNLYDADVRLGHAPHNASQSADLAAPLQPNKDQGHFHGSQDPDLDQMYFDSFGPFNNLNISGSQNYSDQDFSQPQPREDELDHIVAVHHQSLRAQDQAAHDIGDDNVTGFLQVPTAQPWNSVVAAQQHPNPTGNNLQRTQMSRTYQTPTKQQGFVQSDEGYFTTEQPEGYQLSQQDIRSVRSVRSNSFDRSITRTQEVPRSFPGNQTLRPSSHVQTNPDPMDSRQTPNHPGPGSEAEALPGPFKCPEQGCEWSGKTNSDLKKHEARHKLAHKCDVGDCSSAFATINDLIRHKASVHKIREAGTRVHRCFGVGCKNPEKEWPRKDNFRSHLKKTHPNEKEEDLLARDAAWWSSQRQGEMNADVDHGHTRRISSTAPHTIAYSPSFRGPVTPQYPPSTSDSGYANTSPFTPTRTTIPPYVPRDASTVFGNPIPGTPQYFQQQQQRLQHMQSTDIGGYHDDSSVPSVSRSQGLGPGRAQQFSIPTSRNQQRYLGARHSLTTGTSFGHGALGGQQMSYSRSQSYAQNMPSPQMLQPGSGQPVHMLPPQRSEANQQRNTVADPTFLEQDRIELGQDWDEQFVQISALQTFPMLGDDLSQVGHAGTELNKASTNLSLPRITVDTSDERPSGDLYKEFNVEHLKKFLASYERKVTTEQDRALIRSARRTLESTQGAASTDLTLNDGQAEDYIEEFADDASKIAYRCKWLNCKSQKTSWTLRSEIKKHTKRHIRQYGCTFDHCYRRFGSKSDWIRHETKRHSQPECWLCERNNPVPAPVIKPCRKVYLKREQFEAHLDEVHKLTRKNDPRQLNLYITEQHISAGFQPKYWCGFCREILRLPPSSNKGKTAIHARNDHIADHFITEDKCIDDWYPPDGMMSKGERRTKRMGAQSLENDEDDDAGDDGDGDGSPHRPPSEDSSSSDDAPASSHKAPSKPSTSPARPLQGHMKVPPSSQHGLKRTASDAGLRRAQPPAKRPHPNMWTCHCCHFENNMALFDTCNHCNHGRCPDCWRFYRNDRDRMPNPDMSVNG